MNMSVHEDRWVDEGLFDAVKCRIMRIELQLIDLPGRLSEIRTAGEDGMRVQVFSKADDEAISTMGDLNVEDGTFRSYYRQFLELKRKVSFNVHGFGFYTATKDARKTMMLVDDLNAELQGLRLRVLSHIMKCKPSELQRRLMRRFNPRVKCLIFPLTRYISRDECFLDQLARTFKDDFAKRECIHFARWMLEELDDDALLDGKVKGLDLSVRDDLLASYQLSQCVF